MKIELTADKLDQLAMITRNTGESAGLYEATHPSPLSPQIRDEYEDTKAALEATRNTWLRAIKTIGGDKLEEEINRRISLMQAQPR